MDAKLGGFVILLLASLGSAVVALPSPQGDLTTLQYRLTLLCDGVSNVTGAVFPGESVEVILWGANAEVLGPLVTDTQGELSVTVPMGSVVSFRPLLPRVDPDEQAYVNATWDASTTTVTASQWPLQVVTASVCFNPWI